MSKYRIFLLGTNDINEGIKCVDNDIEQIKTFFKNYEYTAKIATATTETTLALELENYISDLNEEDIFIFYYAGHSLLSDNSLYLFINGEEIDFNIAINRILKKNKKIKKVLFILDSCSSGKINSLIDNELSTFRAITATNHVHKSIEMNQNNADDFEIKEPLGFFTHFLLTSMERIFQTSKEIKVNDLGKEIELQIKNYKELSLPTPRLYGGKNNFSFIAKHDCETIINTFYQENCTSDFNTFLNNLDTRIEQCLFTDCSNSTTLKQLIKIFRLENLTPNSKEELLKTINNELKKCL